MALYLGVNWRLGAIWRHLASFGVIWRHFGQFWSFGQFWPDGVIWPNWCQYASFLAPFGDQWPISAILVIFGQKRPILVAFSAITFWWSHFWRQIKFDAKNDQKVLCNFVSKGGRQRSWPLSWNLEIRNIEFAYLQFTDFKIPGQGQLR